MTRRALYQRVVLCLVALGLAPPAAALQYKPRQEDTLSHVALMHYGDPRKIVYLITANGIADPDRLPKGVTLWVPTVFKVRIKKGEDLSTLAGRYLKDERRGESLAWLNRIPDPKDVKVGQTITIPFVLKHRAQAGESLADLSKRYYFDLSETTLLRRFNNRRSNTLKAGEVILIPITDPEADSERVAERFARYRDEQDRASREVQTRAMRALTAQSPAGPPALAPEAVDAGTDTDPQGQPPPGATSPAVDSAREILEAAAKPVDTRATAPADTGRINEAMGLYHDGEFELALASFQQILDRGKTSVADEARLREAIAVCLVALERRQEAEHEFVRLLMVDPERTLDPVTTSPKVLEIFKRAKGAR